MQLEEFQQAAACFTRFGKAEAKLPSDKNFCYKLLAVSFAVGCLLAFSSVLLLSAPHGRILAAVFIPILGWWLNDFRSVFAYLRFIETKLPSFYSPLKTEKGKMFWQFYLFSFFASLHFIFIFLLLSSAANSLWLIVINLFSFLLFAKIAYWKNDEADLLSQRGFLILVGIVLAVATLVGFVMGKILTVFMFVFLLLALFEYGCFYLNKRGFNLYANWLVASEMMTLGLLLVGFLILG